MSTIEPLCDYCVKIELDHERLSKLPAAEARWSIGPGLRIKNSSCPICQLVKHLFYEKQRIESDSEQTGLSKQKDVTLEWFNHAGPGDRGAFRVTTMGEYFICFVGKDGSNGLVSGSEYLRSKLHSELEVSRISSWLLRCRSTHSTSCNIERRNTFEDAFPGLSVLRLIDVRRKCLIETQSICEYVALSYVWGDVPNFRLTKANMRELLIVGSIEAVWDMLPRTIRNAIDLTNSLGLHYLWVDALCLLQNDHEDLQLGVSVMDYIYEWSLLTIIAASGHNADAGLPGVHEGSRKVSELALDVKIGISLGVYTGFEQLLKYSVYNSRAWTFQEQLLARRAVYFVANKVFFRCRQTEYVESCFDHPRSTSGGTTSLLPLSAHMSVPIDDFSIMLLHYSRRVLSNQDDVLRALAGIIRRLSERAKHTFFQGLPTGSLDAFILFRPHDNLLHRRKGFPSYSWIGWKGGIEFDFTFDIADIVNDWLMTKTWIIWYKRSPSGITNLVWDPSANDSFPTEDSEYVGYRERQPFRSPPALKITTSRTSPTEDLPFDIPSMKYHLLQFWTLVVFYQIGDVNVFKAQGKVLDERGSVCGHISLDGFEETTFFDSKNIFEFILLSEKNPHMYNVMLLEWCGGVAQRRGIGTIGHSFIHRGFPPGPAWKEIFLA